jgi:hypothetical protein
VSIDGEYVGHEDNGIAFERRIEEEERISHAESREDFFKYLGDPQAL